MSHNDVVPSSSTSRPSPVANWHRKTPSLSASCRHRRSVSFSTSICLVHDPVSATNQSALMKQRWGKKETKRREEGGREGGERRRGWRRIAEENGGRKKERKRKRDNGKRHGYGRADHTARACGGGGGGGGGGDGVWLGNAREKLKRDK